MQGCQPPNPGPVFYALGGQYSIKYLEVLLGVIKVSSLVDTNQVRSPASNWHELAASLEKGSSVWLPSSGMCYVLLAEAPPGKTSNPERTDCSKHKKQHYHPVYSEASNTKKDL